MRRLTFTDDNRREIKISITKVDIIAILFIFMNLYLVFLSITKLEESDAQFLCIFMGFLVACISFVAYISCKTSKQ